MSDRISKRKIKEYIKCCEDKLKELEKERSRIRRRKRKSWLFTLRLKRPIRHSSTIQRKN